MPGTFQPLVDNQRVVNPDGTPTEYFIRWAQEKQIAIGEGITAEQALAIVRQFTADHPLVGGSGIILTPSGDLADDVTIGADVQAILDQISTTWGAVLFRGTADWQALAPGTSGQFLKTNGAGADPEWAAGGGGGGATMIAEFVSTGVTATATFTAIPNTYKSLRVEVLGRATTGAGNVRVKINNDGSALYAMQRQFSGPFAISSDQFTGQTVFIWLVAMGGSGNMAGTLIVEFPDYANANFYRQMVFRGRQPNSGNGGDAYQIAGAGQYAAAAAINQIDVFVDTGVWATGSTVRLYGIS